MLKGTSVSTGIAIGNIYKYIPFSPNVEESKIDPSEVKENIRLYNDAKQKSGTELNELSQSLLLNHPDKAAIFEAHKEMLDDEALDEEIISAIKNDFKCVDFAVFTSYNTYIDILNKANNLLIRERTEDLKDVRNRIIRNLYNVEETNLSALPYPVIIAANDLLPSDTASMDRENVLGIVTQTGGTTSHTAIIARSYEIPAVSGINGLMEQIENGQSTVLDAVSGNLLLNPTSQIKKEYTEKQKSYLKKMQENKKYANIQAETKDGIKIDIKMNIGSANVPEQIKFSDGTGLFRTEFLYMEQSTVPSEQQQFEEYKSILSSVKKPVYLRTLDIGGDKTLDSLDLPKEDNPFLGKRAIRLCLDREDIFIEQIRAALRASVYGDLWMMIPMISSIEDWRAAKNIVEKVKKDLLNEGIEFNQDFKLGIMIEVPSLVFIAEEIAEEVDFASIGTNDLCQYLFAADRMNPSVSSYAREHSPIMFRTLKTIVSAFNAKDKPISICGELASQPSVVPALIGIGLKNFSMSASSFGSVKKIISKIDYESANVLADKILNMKTEKEAERMMNSFLLELE